MVTHYTSLWGYRAGNYFIWQQISCSILHSESNLMQATHKIHTLFIHHNLETFRYFIVSIKAFSSPPVITEEGSCLLSIYKQYHWEKSQTLTKCHPKLNLQNVCFIASFYFSVAIATLGTSNVRPSVCLSVCPCTSCLNSSISPSYSSLLLPLAPSSSLSL